MTTTLTVTEALEKIHASAKKTNDRKIINCELMPVGEVARQGDIYIVRLCVFSRVQLRIDELIAKATKNQKEEFEAIFLDGAPSHETWPGSRHIIDAPTRYDLHSMTTFRGRDTDTNVRVLLTDYLVKMYENLLEKNRTLNLPTIPTNMVLTPHQWNLRHHEHGDYTFPEGAFAITRQTDLQTQRFVYD